MWDYGSQQPMVGAEWWWGPCSGKESWESCAVSPRTLPHEQAVKGASGLFFCFNWLLWLLEPVCPSGESVCPCGCALGLSAASPLGMELSFQFPKRKILNPGQEG